MAKPNYAYEKRQREIAKQKLKQEKLAKKQAARDAENPSADDNDPAQPASSTETATGNG